MQASASGRVSRLAHRRLLHGVFFKTWLDMQNITDIYAALHAHAGSEVDRLQKKLDFGFEAKATGPGRHLSWERDGAWWIYDVGPYRMIIDPVPTPRALYNWYITKRSEPLYQCKVSCGWVSEVDRDVPVEEVMDTVFDALGILLSDPV